MAACLRPSVIDAFSLGFRVVVAENRVGDHDETAHARKLRDVGRRCADIIDGARAIAAIERWRQANDQ